MSTLTFMATGDSFITRRLPANNEGFRQLSSLIQKADVRLTNLEVTVHNFEGYPSAVSGGTWAIAPPAVLEDLKFFGFNLISWANNHTLDYLHGGLEATERYLNEYGFVHAGVGKNLAQASAPRYLECEDGRVALIAATSTFHDDWVAGDQRPDTIGRPGINPLRFHTTYTVSHERLRQLKSIAEVCEINAERELAIKEGFTVETTDDSVFTFGEYQFVAGEREGKTTRCHERDVNRIARAISEARRQADYVIVSIHSHEMEGLDKAQPAQFLKDFAHLCIDFGADAVVGHGPHILRGIEVYKERPIFYSLGNFIFQNETVSVLPADFYEQYGLDHTHNVADAYDKRSNGGTKGLGVNRLVWESVMAYWEVRGGELQAIHLYPIELGYRLPRYRRGWPVLSRDVQILERLRELSAVYGVDIEITDGVGRIALK